MRNKSGLIVALTAALVPGLANAIGLGEINLQSRIGAPLMAEVAIIGHTGDAPITACFSMATLRTSELPVITTARPKLIRRGNNYVVQIVSSKPINEPVFAIGLRAGCGYDLEREYVLMPEPPLELATIPPPLTETPIAKKSSGGSFWRAREGETLEDIAAARAPNNDAARQRQLAALKRDNRDLDELMPLAEGTLVKLPSRERTPRPSEQTANTPDFPSSHVETPRPRKTPAVSARKETPTANAPSGTGDRLLLGAADSEPPRGNRGSSGTSAIAEAEERLLKLETTLHRLTQEMEKMDQAIDLAAKAVEAQTRLQLAQDIKQASANDLPAVASQTVPVRSSHANWLELVLSAAVGASVSVGMAQYLGRRRRFPGDGETPLAFSGYRAEVAPSVPPPQPSAIAAEPPRQVPPADTPPEAVEEFPVPRLPETGIASQPEPEVIEANREDEHSVLALAEIMLSFGRIRGAAETLAEHIEETIPRNIEPWSMLLDLYRRGGMREEFEALADKMRVRFNANIPAWNELSTPITGLKTLEDFPHVIQKTSRLWGVQEGVDYLYSLVYDTRAGQRNGFPLEVVEEIALLMRILVDGYGLQRPA